MTHPPLLLIAGPTASGKSALGLDLADLLGGEIVNADSMQVYGDLPILSAMPGRNDFERVPHHLYGTVAAHAVWSVGSWLRAVIDKIADIQARGRRPILVGGTGLYFSALTRGLAQIPPVPLAARAALEQLYDHRGEAAFRGDLARVDPAAAARIERGDAQRLIRAMAVHQVSGRPLSAWQADTVPVLAADDWRGLVLDPPRDWLRARCDQRFEAMLQAGALEEVARLAARALPSGAGPLRTLGYGELARHLAGDLSLDQAVVLAQAATRQYAKRQYTWFRNQMPDWARVETVDTQTRRAAVMEVLAQS